MDISQADRQPGLGLHEIRQIKAGAKGTETLAPCRFATGSAGAQLTPQWRVRVRRREKGRGCEFHEIVPSLESCVSAAVPFAGGASGRSIQLGRGDPSHWQWILNTYCVSGQHGSQGRSSGQARPTDTITIVIVNHGPKCSLRLLCAHGSTPAVPTQGTPGNI